MSILRLRSVVGLFTGHTNLRAPLYKLGHTKGKNAGCVDVIKRTVYTLYLTACPNL